MATNNQLIVGVIAAVVLTGLFTGAFSLPGLSVGQDGGDEVRDFEPGKSATVDARTFDQTEDTSTQVGTTVYTRMAGDNGESTISDSSGASSAATFTYATGDTIAYWAHGSTYDYGEQKETLIDSEQKNVRLDVWEGAATGDIALTILEDEGASDDDGSISTLGNNEQQSIDGVEVRVDASNKAFNPHMVAWKYSNRTGSDDAHDYNISSITNSQADSVSCPERLTGYDDCFIAYDSGEEEPTLMEFQETVSTGNFVIEADSDGTATTDKAWATVVDLAPFQDTNDMRATGVEDDTQSPSDVGVGDVTTRLDFE